MLICFSAVTRQVIQTFPPPQLELPLSLLSRLLLCDPARSVFHLKSCAGVFLAGQGRSATWLLSQLLQQDQLWDSAVELLIVLSQIACCSDEDSHVELRLEASVLQRALRHSHCQIKATACRLLGNLNPLGPHSLQPDMFKSMIECLGDCCVPVRRMACRAVGNWLGYVALGSGAQWMREARRAVGALVSLIGDPDALTRRHCCEALGNLRHMDGALPLLLAEDVFALLLGAACTDSHNAVRRAAVATLSLYCRQDRVRQVNVTNQADRFFYFYSFYSPLMIVLLLLSLKGPEVP